MSSLLWLIAATGCLVTSISADDGDCTKAVVQMPIGNVTLASGFQARGIIAAAGIPPQKLAFNPTWLSNDTFLYSEPCPKENFIFSDKACATLRGGLYDASKSTSKGTVNNSYTPVQETFDSSSYKLFTDILQLQEDYNIKDFPMGTPGNTSTWNLQGYRPMNLLGLDKASTLMKTLKNNKRISSWSFGYYWGLDGLNSNDQGSGSFVAGGYDRAKTIGNGITNQLNPSADCPSGMMVTIRDLIVNERNGTDVSIMDSINGGTSMVACISPETPVLMQLPLQPYMKNMYAAIDNNEYGRSTGIDFWNLKLSPSRNLWDGDFTIKFDKLTIKIPNHQMVVPERKIQDSGEITANASSPVLRFNSLQSTTSQSVPVLGRYFFTSAYVHYNLDASTFTLWQSNPTDQQDLVAVDATGKVLSGKDACIPSSAVSSSSSNSSTSSTPSSGSVQSSSLSGGAIGGVVVGAVAGIALIGAAVFFFLRRRKNSQRSGKAVTTSNMMAHTPSSYPPDYVSPLSAGEHGYGYENGGYKSYNSYTNVPQQPQELSSLTAAQRAELSG